MRSRYLLRKERAATTACCSKADMRDGIALLHI